MSSRGWQCEVRLRMQRLRLAWLICLISCDIGQYAAASSITAEPRASPLQREVARARQRRSQRLEDAALASATLQWNHTSRHLLGTRPGWAVPSQQTVRTAGGSLTLPASPERFTQCRDSQRLTIKVAYVAQPQPWKLASAGLSCRVCNAARFRRAGECRQHRRLAAAGGNGRRDRIRRAGGGCQPL